MAEKEPGEPQEKGLEDMSPDEIALKIDAVSYEILGMESDIDKTHFTRPDGPKNAKAMEGDPELADKYETRNRLLQQYESRTGESYDWIGGAQKEEKRRRKN